MKVKVTKIVVFGELIISLVLLGVIFLRPGSSHEGPAAGKAAAVVGHGAAGVDAGVTAKGAEPESERDAPEKGHERAAAAPPQAAHGGAAAGAHGAHGGGTGAGAPLVIHAGEAAGGDRALTGDAKAIARKLLEGNGRFASGELSLPDLVGQRETSAKGQHPAVMVLGCADSRVPPELIFDRGIGELFVVRSAGNIAEPISVGSLEYAAEHLHAKVLLVLGHEKCGAVQAALAEEKMPSPNLQELVAHVAPAIKGLKAWADGADLLRLAVEANVRQQAVELLKRSPILRAAVAKGSVVLLKAVYDIETGRIRPI